MCGIAGIINFDSEHLVEAEKLRQMNSWMQNRGPDNEGYWIDQNIGLAHRRLSIIDLSELGHQPMLTSEEKIAITFNGEIYNFATLQSELKQKGVSFRSNSDTEVLLYGYREWGIEQLLQKIEGMYAFCLVDREQGVAFLGRDVFGKKPLYVHHNQKSISFSSDLRSISKQGIDLTLDLEALSYYLQELGVPQPKTIWKEVQQVRPAHYLTISIGQGKVEQKRYRTISHSNKLDISEQEAESKVEEMLTKAIMKRTVADVPVACFLSGGVDSGLIVSLLAQNSSTPVNTFSVGFGEEEYNELPYAKQLAERYNTNHTELIIEPDITDIVDHVVGDMGEPFADSSIIPTYLVSKAMAQHYKVALSGDGGDELFGYPNYAYYHKVDEFLKAHSSSSSRKMAVMKSKITSRLGSAENLGALNNSAMTEDNGLALMRKMAFAENNLQGLLNNAPAGYTRKYMDKAWLRSDGKSFADRVFAGSLDSRLLNDYLVKVDRGSMMVSLEVRSPFLDADLAEFAFQIPNHIKFKNNEPKHILKHLAVKHIDKDMFKRQKSGFSIPLKTWLRNELKELLQDTLSADSLRKSGVFNPEQVQRLVTEHVSGTSNHEHRLWALLCFESWYQRHNS